MTLPEPLRQAIADLAGGEATTSIRQRHDVLSEGYRAGRRSAGLVAGGEDVAAYVAARMPATYAAVGVALRELAFAAPDFAPRSCLDVGCGPGTATFAALHAFGTIETATGIDHNPAFLAAARSLAPRAGLGEHQHVSFERGEIGTAPLPVVDLGMVAYALVELAEPQATNLALRLFAASQACVFVEPGSPAGFVRLRAIRARLLAEGAHILAPCPHAAACPIVAPDWCHFSVRLARSRIHKAAKAASVPYEDEKFSYLIAARTGGPQWQGRIIAPVHHGKAAQTARICTNGAIEVRTIRPRDADFKRAKKWRWGDGV